MKERDLYARTLRLRGLGFRSYREYLRSPEWRIVKARYRASDLPQDCGLCGADEGLQLHHMTYERVCAEKLTDLVPLCSNCHAMVHVLERRGEVDLDLAGLVDARRAERYRIAQEQRHAERFADSDMERLEAENKRQYRSLMRRLRWTLEGHPDPPLLLDRLYGFIQGPTTAPRRYL